MSEPTGMRGECLACSKLGSCSETSVERARSSYTCPLFEEVPEPVYLARWEMMKTHGEVVAIEAMIDLTLRAPQRDGEENGDR